MPGAQEKPEPNSITAIEGKIREKDKAARELEASASGIDAAVYDLKAANPNAVTRIDERTPQEIIESIEQQGRIVTDALNRLRGLLK